MRLTVLFYLIIVSGFLLVLLALSVAMNLALFASSLLKQRS